MRKGADGLPDMSTRQTFAAQANGPVWLTQGPDGALYYADLAGGTIRRIQTTNNAPTARIVATPTSGVAPLTTSFDATTSSDPDGQALTYAWDLDGDGAYDDSTAATPSFTYTAAGVYTVRLQVTDTAGLIGTATQTITAGAPPAVSLTSPAPGTTWAVGDTVDFAATANVPASGLTWSLSLRHCSRTDATVCHTHAIQDYVGVASGSFVAPDHEYPSHLLLSVTARDAAGLTVDADRPAGPTHRERDARQRPDWPHAVVRQRHHLRAVHAHGHRALGRTRSPRRHARPRARSRTRSPPGATASPRRTRSRPLRAVARPPTPPATTRRALYAGTDAVGTHTSKAAPGRAQVYETTATRTGTASALRLYVDAGNSGNRLVLGVYADSGGEPGRLLGSGSARHARRGTPGTASPWPAGCR